MNNFELPSFNRLWVDRLGTYLGFGQMSMGTTYLVSNPKFQLTQYTFRRLFWHHQKPVDSQQKIHILDSIKLYLNISYYTLSSRNSTHILNHIIVCSGRISLFELFYINIYKKITSPICRPENANICRNF